MTDGPKQPNFPNLIVSVESRKGGVGKTTAALCLGRILRRRGYAVLVMDMDVTGTNAADIAKSPFWSSDLHVICRPQTNSRVEKKSVNLLELFDELFMSGQTVPRFTIASQEADCLPVDLEKVNVFGSQIYHTKDPEKDATLNDRLTCLGRPSVLFDDLHSLWLLDFLKQRASDFCRAAHSADSPRPQVAIILDNSPGYVGIAPKIHEWLTDCGPVVGKFLTVASLDLQDLLACGRAIDLIHVQYQSKWKTSRLFLEACKTSRGFSLAEEQEAFFFRLATESNKSDDPADQLTFFKTGAHSSKKSDDNNGEVFLGAPWKYLGLLVNRVPRAVKRGYLVIELPSNNSHGLSSVVNASSHAEGLTRWREHMVSYDEYIENQFFLQSLQQGKRRPARRLHQLIKTIENETERLGMEMHGVDGAMHLFRADIGSRAHVRSQLIRFNELVIRVRSALDDAGLGHLARLVHDEWLPGSIVPSFRSALSTMLREIRFPYFDMMPFEFELGPSNPEARDFVSDLKKNLVMEMREREMNVGERDEETIEILASVMASLADLALASQTWNSPVHKEMVGLFASILSIELRHWKKHSESRLSSLGVQQFLARESIKHAEIENERMMPKSLRFMPSIMRRNGESAFSDFYAACTTAQARLIDFAADSQFLIRLMQFMVQEEIEPRGFFPFIRGLVEDVIERKTIRHEEARAKMAKALQSAKYFVEFDQVLDLILKNWGIANG